MASENCKFCGKTGYTGEGGYIEGWLPIRNFVGGVTGYYCSKKCKIEGEGSKSSTGNTNQSEGESAKHSAEAEKIRAEAEKIRAEDEGDRLRDEQENQMKKELESKIKEIASIDFGSSKDSVSDVLDQLVIIGSSKPTPKERKAIFDKMEIGIMKLKKMGETDCSYYEQKMLKIKPSIWQKIGYYFANN